MTTQKTYSPDQKAFHKLYLFNLLREAIRPNPTPYTSVVDAEKSANNTMVGIVNKLTTFEQECLISYIENLR